MTGCIFLILFPYDFDLGYADSNVNMPKKLYNIGHKVTEAKKTR